MEEPTGRVKHTFSVATGCSARLLWHFRAGTDARVAARGQAGDRPYEPARRRAGAAVDGRGYQVRRWSNAYSCVGWAWGSKVPAPASGRSHSGGPRRARCGVARPRRRRGIAGRLVNGGLPEDSTATPTGGLWPVRDTRHVGRNVRNRAALLAFAARRSMAGRGRQRQFPRPIQSKRSRATLTLPLHRAG